VDTSKGTRFPEVTLAADGCNHVYGNGDQLVIQTCRAVPTEDDILSPSFNIAVRLLSNEALELASELFAVVSSHIDRLRNGTAK
jgi:hypothetical protein